MRTLGTSSILVHSAHAIASASQSTRAPNLVPIVNLFSIVDHADFAIRIGINLSPSGTKVGVGILHTKSTQNFSTSFHPHVGGGEEDGAPAPKGAGGSLPPGGGELMGGGGCAPGATDSEQNTAAEQLLVLDHSTCQPEFKRVRDQLAIDVLGKNTYLISGRSAPDPLDFGAVPANPRDVGAATLPTHRKPGHHPASYRISGHQPPDPPDFGRPPEDPLDFGAVPANPRDFGAVILEPTRYRAC